MRDLITGRFVTVSAATLLRSVPEATSSVSAIPFIRWHQEDLPEPEPEKGDPLDSLKDVADDVTQFIEAI